MNKEKFMKSLDLWIILAVVTLAAILSAILLAVRPNEIKKIEDVKTLTTENYNQLDKNEKKRYIVVCDSSDKSNLQMINTTIRYAEFARKNRKAPKIYFIDLESNDTIIKALEDASISPRTAPLLLTVSLNDSNEVKVTSKNTQTSICNELERIISGKTQ